MGFFERAGEPGIGGTIDGMISIVETKIAEDLGARRIDGANLRSAVKDAVGLIEIYGLGDIGGNERVVFVWLGDAVDLDGEKDRDGVALERTRELDGFRSAPAMAVNYNSRALLFGGRELAIMIRVEKAEDFAASLVGAMVFENLHVHTFGEITAKLSGELDFSMDGIIAAHPAANESDHDGRRLCKGFFGARPGMDGAVAAEI